MMKAAWPRAPKAFGVYVAASLGFEPRQGDPESPVLPLQHEATSEKIKARIAHCKSTAVAFAMRN